MKNIFLTLLIIFLTISARSQQTEPKQQLAKQEYLKKSKSQKTAAWILLGAGTAMTVGASIWVANNLFGPDQGEGVLFLAGLGAMAGSIPLFIASGRNKRKANEIGVVFNMKLEKCIVVQNEMADSNYYPALSLKIGFK
jgi:hypothetical protein